RAGHPGRTGVLDSLAVIVQALSQTTCKALRITQAQPARHGAAIPELELNAHFLPYVINGRGSTKPGCLKTSGRSRMTWHHVARLSQSEGALGARENFGGSFVSKSVGATVVSFHVGGLGLM